MAFEFLELCNSGGQFGYSERDSDIIKITIKVRDHTGELFTSLSDSFSEFAEVFEEYYNTATEFCSYSSIDGYFNDFFIEAMSSKYSGDPQSAPWILGPTYLAIHRDLLQNQFGGDKDAITTYATILSEQIAPSTGTYDSLKTFKENLDELQQYYADSIEEISEQVEHSFIGQINVSEFSKPDFTNLSADMVPMSNPFDESVTYKIKSKLWGIYKTYEEFLADAANQNAWAECDSVILGAGQKGSKCDTWTDNFRELFGSWGSGAGAVQESFREIYELALDQGAPNETGGRYQSEDAYEIENPAQGWLDAGRPGGSKADELYTNHIDFWMGINLIYKYQELRIGGMCFDSQGQNYFSEDNDNLIHSTLETAIAGIDEMRETIENIIALKVQYYGTSYADLINDPMAELLAITQPKGQRQSGDDSTERQKELYDFTYNKTFGSERLEDAAWHDWADPDPGVYS